MGPPVSSLLWFAGSPGQLRASPTALPRRAPQPLSAVLKLVTLSSSHPYLCGGVAGIEPVSQVCRRVLFPSWPNSTSSGEMDIPV